MVHRNCSILTVHTPQRQLYTTLQFAQLPFHNTGDARLYSLSCGEVHSETLWDGAILNGHP